MRWVGGPLHGQERPDNDSGRYAYAIGVDGTDGGEPFACWDYYIQDGVSASFMGCRPPQPEWPLR